MPPRPLVEPLLPHRCFLYFCHFGILNKRILNTINFKILEMLVRMLKPNDRVGPVLPKIYQKSDRPACKPYFMSSTNSRACHPLVSNRVR